jgi:hypothetical protein
MIRRKRQALVLFIVAPIGLLGFIAHVQSRDIPLAIMFGIVTPAAVALGVWLWRLK